jgi:hypothetical protein
MCSVSMVIFCIVPSQICTLSFSCTSGTNNSISLWVNSEVIHDSFVKILQLKRVEPIKLVLVPVPSQESQWPWICVLLGIDVAPFFHFSIPFWKCSRRIHQHDFPYSWAITGIMKFYFEKNCRLSKLWNKMTVYMTSIN